MDSKIDSQRLLIKNVSNKLSDLTIDITQRVGELNRLDRERKTAQRAYNKATRHLSKMIAHPELDPQELDDLNRNGAAPEHLRVLGIVLILLVVVGIVIYSLIAGPEKTTEDGSTSPDNAPTQEIIPEAAAAEIEQPWYMAWDDLQGPPPQEEYLWSISQYWDELASSPCPAGLMASIWHAETGNDVTSDNPFQILGASTIPANASRTAFSEQVQAACNHLSRSINRGGNQVPETVNRESIGIWMDAAYSYNGRAYGPSWTDSPYIVNNLDSAHTGMKHCAVDGCGWLSTKDKDGVLTFWLKYERLINNKG